MILVLFVCVCVFACLHGSEKTYVLCSHYKMVVPPGACWVVAGSVWVWWVRYCPGGRHPYLLGDLPDALHAGAVQVAVVLAGLDEAVALDVLLHLFP